MLSTQTPAMATSARRLAGLAVGGILIAVGTVLVLHVVPPTSRLDPYHETISAYGLTDIGWIFNAAVVLLAASSLLVIVALVLDRQLRALSIGSVMLMLWVLGMAAVATFEKTDWAVGPSVTGSIHRAASLVAFVALPIGAACVIGHGLRRWSSAPHRGLLVAALIFTTASVGYLCYVVWLIADARASHVAWWQAIPLGLTERVLVVLETGALLCIALRTARSVTKTSRSVTKPRSSVALSDGRAGGSDGSAGGSDGPAGEVTCRAS